VADAYDEPLTTISDLMGLREHARDRVAIASDTNISHGQPAPLPSQQGTAAIVDGSNPLPFTATGIVGKVGAGAATVASLHTRTSATDGGYGGDGGGSGGGGGGSGGGGSTSPTVLGTFADGSPAVIRNRGTAAVGKGTAVHFLWMPGVSYWYSSVAPCPPKHKCGSARRVGDVNIQRILADVAIGAGVTAPVVTSGRSIETPLMLTPDGKSAVVTLLNFKAGSCTWSVSAFAPAPPVDACLVPCSGFGCWLV
jgi:hypothetical protein